MNILHIVSGNDSYDAVHTALDLSKHLNKNNIKSLIASSFNVGVLENISSDVEIFNIPQFEKDIKDFIVSYNILKAKIRVNNIDIIHIHSVTSVWLAFLLCRNTGTRLVASSYNFHRKNIFNQGLILANTIVVHNEAVGQQIINDFRLSQHKVKFIEPIIDIDNFKFQSVDERSKTDFTIGFIPSLLPDSGYEYFLKAMVRVLRIIPYINIYVLISRSCMRKNIKEDLEFWTRRLGLSNYVRFQDASNLDLKYLTKFNLLVYAPIIENALTRLIIEAQAYGVPVISGHVGGISQIISDNKTGILVAPRDNVSLTNAIIKALKDFAFMREIVLTARKNIEERFNIDKNINKFITIYQEMKDARKILVVSLGGVDDVVSTIPVLNLLKNNMPQAQIAALISPGLRCLLQHCPYVDELIVFKNKDLFFSVKLVKLIIEKNFDMVFDLNNNFKSQTISYLSLAGSRFGYRNRIIKFLINNNIRRPNISSGLIEDKLSILDLLRINKCDYKLELWPSKEDEDFVDDFFQDNWIGKEKVVLIDIASTRSFFMGNKVLTGVAYLCNSLTKQNMRIVIFGSRRNIIKIKADLFNKIKSQPILFISDITPLQLASLIRKCSLYISFRSASIYIARAMYTPSLFISLRKDTDNLFTLKNIATLPIGLFHFNRNHNYKNKKSKDIPGRDIVMQTISNLIEAR